MAEGPKREDEKRMEESDVARPDQSTLPNVSVIVPVYNDQARIGVLIESLLAQDYPKDKVEILVVDNRSTDASRDVVRRYPVRLLEETRVQSSYAARNRAVRATSHEILAFIDSDCTADPAWLAEGVRTLLAEQADLVGGKVEFTFASPTPSAAELYDSLQHFNFQKTIAQRSGTGAGNLFTRKRVFDLLGEFPEVRSGGDFQWSARAFEKNLKVVFAPGAVIGHPARRFGEILKKQYRTGTGYPHQRLAKGHSRAHEFFYLFFRLLCTGIPVTQIRRAIREDGRQIHQERFWGIVWTAWICIITYRFGSWVEFLKMVCSRRVPNE